MARTRFTRALATAAIGVVVLGSGAAAVAATPHAATRTPLTAAGSSRPAQLAVVGVGGGHVVIQDRSDAVVYAADPSGGTAPAVVVRDAVAEALAGPMLTYRTASGAHRWHLLDTTRYGDVPSTWTVPAPDGGMRVRTVGAAAFLDYLHLDGTTTSYPLPATFPAGATYTILAQGTGVVVSASAPGAVPQLAYLPPTGPQVFTRLDTDGLPKGAMLRCKDIGSPEIAAVGCLAPSRVTRISTVPGVAPQTEVLAGTVLDVAVGSQFTNWTESYSDSQHCPCVLTSLSTDGTAVAATRGLTSGTLAGDGNAFYVAGSTIGSAGVFSAEYAGGDRTRVATAAAGPLTASAPALGPGRAAWVDDSSSGGPVRTAQVGPSAAAGTARRIASGARLLPVGVSGLRTVYTAHDGTLRRVFDGGLDSVIATGTLLGVSGTRVLLRATNGHLLVRDLVAQRSVDLTRTLAARSAALWGGYVSFARADGSVWRATAAGAHAVRLSPARPNSTVTSVAAWGDWTAWSVRSGDATTTSFRNARTLAAARTVPAGRTLAGASAGGLLVAAAGHYELRGWATGELRVTIAAGTDATGRPAAAPAVDGGLYVTLVRGRPTVSTLGIHVTDRPRSLGNPYAPATARRGGSWRFELPTSAVLTACTITISRGAFRAQVPCSGPAAATGEVLGTWHPRKGATPIPALRYRWTVHARGADGSLLATDGTGSAVTGTFVLS